MCVVLRIAALYCFAVLNVINPSLACHAQSTACMYTVYACLFNYKSDYIVIYSIFVRVNITSLEFDRGIETNVHHELSS